jgi:hypothetical protein
MLPSAPTVTLLGFTTYSEPLIFTFGTLYDVA